MCWKIIDEDTNGICEFFWKPCMHNCMVGTGRSLQMLCCQMTSLAHAGWWRLSVLLVCADFCSTSRASSDDDQEPVQGPHGAPKKWDTDSVHSCALSLVSCSPKNLVTDSVQWKLQAMTFPVCSLEVLKRRELDQSWEISAAELQDNWTEIGKVGLGHLIWPVVVSETYLPCYYFPFEPFLNGLCSCLGAIVWFALTVHSCLLASCHTTPRTFSRTFK